MNMTEETARAAQGFRTMASSIEFAVNYTKWIVSYFRPYLGSSVLEVGTGTGSLWKLNRCAPT